MDINTAQRQMHIKDNPGYVMTEAFVASSFDSPPDIEAAWEKDEATNASVMTYPGLSLTCI